MGFVERCASLQIFCLVYELIWMCWHGPMLILNCFLSEIIVFPGRYFIIMLYFNHSNVKFAWAPEYSQVGQTVFFKCGNGCWT